MAASTFNTPHAPIRLSLSSRSVHERAPTLEATIFQPLDPDIVSASIPAFFVGRNQAGFWVAREARGLVGGLFLLKSSAVAFARQHSLPLRCALIFPSKTFELDIENRGNALIARLARWIAHSA